MCTKEKSLPVQTSKIKIVITKLQSTSGLINPVVTTGQLKDDYLSIVQVLDIEGCGVISSV